MDNSFNGLDITVMETAYLKANYQNLSGSTRGVADFAINANAKAVALLTLEENHCKLIVIEQDQTVGSLVADLADVLGKDECLCMVITGSADFVESVKAEPEVIKAVALAKSKGAIQ